MSDESTTTRKLPAWALLAGATVLAVGARVLIAFVERREVFHGSRELTALSISAVALAAVVGAYIGRRWINRLSGLLLGVVFAGIAALFSAGSSNVVAGLGVGLFASGMGLCVRDPRRLGFAAGLAIVAAASIAFALPSESPLIWACLAGAGAFSIYGYRIPRREGNGWKPWLALAGRTVAIMLVIGLAAWWASIAQIRAMIAEIQGTDNSIGFCPIPQGPLHPFRTELEASGLVPVESLGLTMTVPDSRFVAGLGRLTALENLKLTGATLDEQALAGLARAPALTTLQLTRCRVAEDGWAELARSSSLSVLLINCTEIGAKGISSLAKIPTLTMLSLENSGGDAEALAAFAPHAGLSALHLSGPTVTAACLRTLDRLSSVSVLSLANRSDAGQTSDAATAILSLREVSDSPELAAVRGARNLKSLQLSISLDEELRRGLIRETPNLLQLNLSPGGEFHPDPTDLEGPLVQADFSYSGEITDLLDLLQQMPELRCVDMSGNGLQAGDLALLASLAKLEKLVLDRARILPEEFRDLAKAPLLSTVSLRIVSVPDWSLALKDAQFSQWPALGELDLAYNGIVDADLSNLGALPNLRALNLKGNPLTDAALAHLVGMTALERLDLRETQVTAAGVQSIRKRLPLLEIRWDEK